MQQNLKMNAELQKEVLDSLNLVPAKRFKKQSNDRQNHKLNIKLIFNCPLAGQGTLILY